MNTTTETHLLKTGDVCQLLRKRFGIQRSEKTLVRYRSDGLGPAYLKRPDGSVFYSEKDIMEWGQAYLAGTCRILPRYRQNNLFED